MDETKDEIKTIDAYIRTFPEDVQTILEKIRLTIRTEVPDAVETISYQIPTFKLNGRNLVYFAGWRNHVSLYPIPSGSEAFKKKVSRYQTGKGTVQFSIDQPLPLPLIREIVKHHVKGAEKRAQAKSPKAKPKRAKRKIAPGR